MLNWDHQLDLIQEHSQDSTGAVHANKVCIISLEDGEILTSLDQDHTFNIMQDEAKTIANSFKTKDFSSFKKDGIKIEDKNYMLINVTTDNIVFGRRDYEGTITMQCSLSTVLVGFTLDGYQQANTNLALGEIAHYLIEKEGL
ncbi:MAG: profilin [Campylobacterota bacterium]|nr:profilin [Campylobacterota bacterium]